MMSGGGANLVMTASWHQALAEAKRQYEAIDRALEVSPKFSKVLEKLLVHKMFQCIPMVRCFAYYFPITFPYSMFSKVLSKG